MGWSEWKDFGSGGMNVFHELLNSADGTWVNKPAFSDSSYVDMNSPSLGYGQAVWTYTHNLGIESEKIKILGVDITTDISNPIKIQHLGGAAYAQYLSSLSICGNSSSKTLTFKDVNAGGSPNIKVDVNSTQIIIRFIFNGRTPCSIIGTPKFRVFFAYE